MGVEFWSGIMIGFGLSIFFWVVTTQALVARLTVLDGLDEAYDKELGYSYRLQVRNEGQRDAMDVTVRCTLYSQQWATDDADLIALIDLPVSQNGSIDIMEGRHSLRNVLHRGRPKPAYAYPRVISFRPSEITDFQKRKLKGDKYAHPRTRLENNQLPLAELMALGNDSRINVALLAFDRLSGTRNISNSHCFRPEDIRHYQTVP